MPDFLKKLPDGGSGTSLAQETVGVGDFNRVVGVLNGTDGPMGAAFQSANPQLGLGTVVAPLGGALDDTANLLAAIATAGETGLVRGVPGSTYNISSTVTFKGDCDFRGCIFSYTGSGIAVQLGDGNTDRFDHWYVLPDVVQTVKVWNSTDIGIVVGRLDSCHIFLRHYQSFSIGLQLLGGNANGCAYNNFYAGWGDDNQVNQDLSPAGTGWTNQNSFFGGRLSHLSADGVHVAGAVHVRMAPTSASTPNNNQWFGTSLEGLVAVYEIDIQGSYNQWINCRFETPANTPHVNWRSGATRNEIRGGYNSESIVYTYGDATATRNNSYDSVMTRLQGGGSNSQPTVLLENETSSAQAALTVMDAGALIAGTDPATGFDWQLTGRLLKGKRVADANDRVELDPQNGQLQFGPGNAVVDSGVKRLGTNIIVPTFGEMSHIVQAPAFSATPSPNPQSGGVYHPGLMTGAVNVANPPAALAGTWMYLVWDQDTTGGRVLTYSGTNWRSVGIAAQVTTLSTRTIDYAFTLDGTVWMVSRLVTGQTL